MPFGIQIKVDATQAVPAIDSVKTKLTEVEQKARDANAALSQGLDPAAKAFHALADAIKRESDMLEQINGPAQRYMQDLQTLDALHAKGKITAEQYEGQIRRLTTAMEQNKKAEEGGMVEGSFGQSISGRFGEAGELFSTFASKGTLAAGAAVGLGVELVHLSDEYTQLSNASLRLAEDGRQTSQVMREQLDVAGDLHASLEQTIELSTVVKERTDDLNLSHTQQIQLTRSLGEASMASGHAAGDAAGMFDRVAFALEAGLPAGRQMKELLRDYKPLSDALSESMHMSTAQIIELAQKGHLSFRDFTDAVIAGSDKIAEKAARVDETWTQHLGHFKDQMLATGLGTRYLVDAIFSEEQATSKWNSAVADALELFNKQTEAVSAQYDAIQSDVFAHTDLMEAVNRTAAAMSAGNDITVASTKHYTDAAAKVDAYKVAVLALQAQSALFKGAGMADPTKALTASDVATLRGYADAQQALLDESSRYGGILADIHKREDERRRGIEDLTGALKAHLITQKEFDDEIKRFEDRTKKPINYAAGFNANGLARGNIQRSGGLYDPQLETGGGDYTKPEADPEAQRALEIYKSIATPMEKYRDELAEINRLHADGKLYGDAYDRVVGALKQKYADMISPTEKYAELQQQIRDAEAQTIITHEQAADALDKLAQQYDHSFGQGLKNAFHSLSDEAKNAAKDMESAITSALHNLNQQIVSFVETGHADLRGLLRGIETDALNMGLKQGESALFGLFGGGSGGAGGGAALTASAGALTGSAGSLVGAAGALIGAAGALGAGGAVTAGGLTGGAGFLGGGLTAPSIPGLGGAPTAGTDRQAPINVHVGGGLPSSALMGAMNTATGQQAVARVVDGRSALDRTLRSMRPSSR